MACPAATYPLRPAVRELIVHQNWTNDDTPGNDVVAGGAVAKIVNHLHTSLEIRQDDRGSLDLEFVILDGRLVLEKGGGDLHLHRPSSGRLDDELHLLHAD